ncbi:MAG: phosphoenolpyruvate--protein phosphotransferase [Firmicutes bacterium]|nr:phosphoenolpyruvate--protein phosphotransferase [Bacillota bacterium]
MITIQGQGVCGGIAFGKLYRMTKGESKVKRAHISDADAEIKRFEAARARAYDELGGLYEKALGEVGEENAMIFQIHQMMLDDADYLESIRSIIADQKLNAETAVAMTADNFAEMFASMDDSYMQARAADVRDISERVITVLAGGVDGGINSSEPVIIAAEDLAPSETVQLEKSKILAFVTEKGSASSHTSILARTMNIPAVIGAAGITDKKYENAEAIVDGFGGKIYIEPNEEIVKEMTERKAELDKENELLSSLKGVKARTKDGQSMLLYANIGHIDDIAPAFKNGAEGVGLFRSEFIYLESKTYPTEDEQFSVYKAALEKMAGKRVIIRTLDIGADKRVDYFDMPAEENPAMGVRAIRICLTRPELFKTQLRALYRASAFGRLGIMFPMIVSVEEVTEIKRICAEVRAELKDEGVPFDEKAELGIMIETPAAALISDKLAREVDFFSIGTNDLTQYTTAVDRQNPTAARFCNERHTAVLRLIKMVVDNSHKCGIWTGICGELGADESLTELFLAMGVDELSVSPGRILPIKKKVLDTDVSEIRDAALELLK